MHCKLKQDMFEKLGNAEDIGKWVHHCTREDVGSKEHYCFCRNAFGKQVELLSCPRRSGLKVWTYPGQGGSKRLVAE